MFNFARRLTVLGLLLAVYSYYHHVIWALTMDSQQPDPAPPPGLPLLQDNPVQIVHRAAPADVRARYQHFINKYSYLTTSTRPGFTSVGEILSLVYFQDASDEHRGSWGLLVSYEGDDAMPPEKKYVYRGSLGHDPTRPVQPLDPTADRFVWAIAPRARFGRLLSAQGKILAPKPTGKDARPSLTGALYVSTDPRHGGAAATIGGIIVAVDYQKEKRYSGLAMGTVWDGQPRTGPAQTMSWPRVPAPIERGEGELILAPAPAGTSDDDDDDAFIVADERDPIPEALYTDFGPAEASGDVIKLDFPITSRALPHCLVKRTGEGVEMPMFNALSSGEAVGLSEEEPAAGTVVYVATAVGWGNLPKLEVLDLPSAWVDVPYSIGPSKSRPLRILPGSRLHPRDIGAWVITETDKGLKACYQIVALGQPDIVYAVPVMDAIWNADNAHIITLAGHNDGDDHWSLAEWADKRYRKGDELRKKHGWWHN